MVEEHKNATHSESWYNLTERDLTMFAYQKLKERVVDYRIHSELRPYDLRQNKVIISRNESAEWQAYTPNTGAKFDLCVIEKEPSFLSEITEVLKSRYGRAPTYPRQAFKAIMEFKVRATGNRHRIRRDFEKIARMCAPPSLCLGYFIILDKYASNRTLDNIERGFQRIREESGARMYYFDSRHEA